MKRMRKGVVWAWGEIFLKSRGVRRELKEKLLLNLRHFLKKEGVKFRVRLFHSRGFVRTEEVEHAKKVLSRVFGVVWSAKAFFLEGAEFREVERFVAENWRRWVGEGETFALRLRRGPTVKKERGEIIDRLAAPIERGVDLEEPGVKIFVEGRKGGWFLHFEKQKGPGGLPVGTQGRVLCLVSGGIDSPVASFLMAKRGVRNQWLHFHSFPILSKKGMEKVRDLAEVFTRFQPGLKVHFTPFAQIQKEIKTGAPAKYRVLLYRRLMLRIGERIAEKENCKGLVTGESLGQVSSQTLTNLGLTRSGLSLPVFSPLIGFNKEEIVKLARGIGSFSISTKPQEDCCTLFVSPGQTGAGERAKLRRLEERLGWRELVARAVEKTEKEEF